uniref:Reverse transcriptase domain-containing protein n=1 Tax=Tanacetum cinerariifolium TaxID=118510 RepID=A0A699GRC0_TANCI|nr:reverse transcriptase domain-containing protein [Tanacetum cinerariifolium]
MYQAAAKEAISVILMTKRNGKQMPIYFVSRVLQGPEVNYTPMEKLILALLLSNPEVAKKLLKWRFKLEEHDIHYRLRKSVKGQILADFIVERSEDDPPDTPIEDKEELPDPWVNGVYVAKEPGMIKYLKKVKNLTNDFEEFSIKQVPKGENKKANALSKMASTSFAHLSKQVLVEELNKKLIDKKEILAVVEEGRTWMTPIYEYLTEEILPKEKRKARAIRRKAGARNLIKECNSCQVHRPVPRNPQQKLTPITSPWPFYKLGIDIAGPFSEGPSKVKFLIVAIDYFTKLIEAKPVVAIMGAQVKKFVWDNIVCRFGLLGEIISDNGKQFMDNPFKDWCEKLCIRQCFASVKHPQANDLVERANRSLGEGIKARLDERSKNWLKEISHVLWAHRTMIKSSNGETLFSLTYGAEVVILVEIDIPTLRTMEVDMIKNDEALGVSLDLLEEKREQAAIQEAKSKAKMEKYYNTGSAAQAFVRKTSSTETIKQVIRKIEASSVLSGRNHMKSRKHWAKERTSLETATKISFREHEISATLGNVICMKCKHLSHKR